MGEIGGTMIILKGVGSWVVFRLARSSPNDARLWHKATDPLGKGSVSHEHFKESPADVVGLEMLFKDSMGHKAKLERAL